MIDIKAGIEQRAYDEGKPIWQETLEVTLGGSLDDTMTFFGGGEGIEAEMMFKKMGGRLGNEVTRKQIHGIASELESRGYTITGGGGRQAEEYLKPLGGGRKGGSYVDLTATKDGRTIRINTADTYKNGRFTRRELKNANRIRSQTSGDHLILMPKYKK